MWDILVVLRRDTSVEWPLSSFQITKADSINNEWSCTESRRIHLLWCMISWRTLTTSTYIVYSPSNPTKEAQWPLQRESRSTVPVPAPRKIGRYPTRIINVQNILKNANQLLALFPLWEQPYGQQLPLVARSKGNTHYYNWY